MAQRKAGIASLQIGRFVGVTNLLLPQLVHPRHLAGPIGEELKAMAARVGRDAFLRQERAILVRAAPHRFARRRRAVKSRAIMRMMMLAVLCGTFGAG